jgi:hypothetical protein
MPAYRVAFTQAGPFRSGRIVTDEMVNAVNGNLAGWIKMGALVPVDPAELAGQRPPRLKAGDIEQWMSPEQREQLNAYEDALDDLDDASAAHAAAKAEAEKTAAGSRMEQAKRLVDKRREQLEQGGHADEINKIHHDRAKRN